MKKLRYEVGRCLVGGYTDVAYLNEGDDPGEELKSSIIEAVHLDIEVTISDVTMPLAMWEDPDHWAEDWATKLSVELDDAPEAVAALIASATTEDK